MQKVVVCPCCQKYEQWIWTLTAQYIQYKRSVLNTDHDWTKIMKEHQSKEKNFSPNKKKTISSQTTEPPKRDPHNMQTPEKRPKTPTLWTRNSVPRGGPLDTADWTQPRSDVSNVRRLEWHCSRRRRADAGPGCRTKSRRPRRGQKRPQAGSAVTSDAESPPTTAWIIFGGREHQLEWLMAKVAAAQQSEESVSGGVRVASSGVRERRFRV